MRLTRRCLLALPAAALPLMPRGAGASGGFARVAAVSGDGGLAVLPDGTTTALASGLTLPDGSRIETREGGLAELAFDDGTRVHAGGATLVSLQGGGAQGTAALTMVGVMVVDRREAPRGEPLTVSGTGFDVTLAGAQVFIESLRAEGGAEGGAVFVKEGGATVASPLGEILLAAGEGVDIAALPAPPAPGAAPEVMPEPDGIVPEEEPPTSAPPPPAAVARWSEERVADAFASVGLTT